MSDLKIVNVKIGDLKFAEYNPRRASEKDIEGLKESIKEFGLVDPIIVNSAKERNNIIVGGHFRVRIAKEMGIKEVPVVYVNIPDIKKEQELNLRLNKNLGQWDYDLLANFDEDLLKDVGWESEELDKIFNLEASEDDFDAQAEYEKIKEPKVKTGDLYQLGGHRLLCGDSTKREDVERLMGGALADMVFTDPPYNIGYHSLGGQSYNEGKYKGANKKGVFSDNKKPAEYLEFLKSTVKNCIDFSRDKIAIFLWNGDRFLDIAIQSLKENKCSINQIAVWIKNGFVWSPGCVFHKALEYCVIGFKNGHKPKINTKYARFHSNLIDLDFEDFQEHFETWFVKRDALMKYKHPTQKPVRLAEPAIKAVSERNNIVLDLFGGSGSTLIACEQLKRKCFAIELDPKYCEVIIQRWEKFTGNKAKKL